MEIIRKNWILICVAILVVVLLSIGKELQAFMVMILMLLFSFFKPRPNPMVHTPSPEIEEWIGQLNPEWTLDELLQFAKKSFQLDKQPYPKAFQESPLWGFEAKLVQCLSKYLAVQHADSETFDNDLQRSFLALQQVDRTIGTRSSSRLLEELVEVHLYDSSLWKQFEIVLRAYEAVLSDSVFLNEGLEVLSWAPHLGKIIEQKTIDAKIGLFYKYLHYLDPIDIEQQSAVFLQLIESIEEKTPVSDACALQVAWMFRTYSGYLKSEERKFVMRAGLSSKLGMWMVPFYTSFLPDFGHAERKCFLECAEYPEDVMSEMLEATSRVPLIFT